MNVVVNVIYLQEVGKRSQPDELNTVNGKIWLEKYLP